ncbi:MAG: ThuA domain-containing protein [Bacteroidetes bacterium]|jgi:type 1 glutamine amidotransferase|nr:ThuA domain-containing protein [Bacteroidota bacterium]
MKLLIILCDPSHFNKIFSFVLLISFVIGTIASKIILEDAQSESHEVLIVGGGTHHDFERWFNEEDKKIISETGASVSYTDEPDEILPMLSDLDVLYLSNNKPLPGPKLREAIFEFIESGNGLLLVHPAVWYNWEDWPEYNRDLVGGGSRSHPPYGEFEVTVTETDHPLMAGVPGQFTIKDELYRFEEDPDGTDNYVLATGLEEENGNEYPVVWTAEYGKGRIVAITLGHDGEAHQHPAYIALLQNSIKWLTETK